MTLSTLRFGGTASAVISKITPNIKKSDKNSVILAAYKQDIANLRNELKTVIQKRDENENKAETTRKQLESWMANLEAMLFSKS